MEINPVVYGMAIMRFLFGLFGIIGAFLMIRNGSVQQAVKINGILGSIGPFIFLAVSLLGISQMVGRVSWEKIILVVIGVILILWGTR